YTRDGLSTGMVTVMRDVTDLRKADQELQSNYEKLRFAEDVVRQDRDRLNLVIENVGDPIVVCDNEGKVVLLDPLAKGLFGSATHVGSGEICRGRPPGGDYRSRSEQSHGGHQELNLSAFQQGGVGCGAGLRDLEIRDRARRPHRSADAGALSQPGIGKAGRPQY